MTQYVLSYFGEPQFDSQEAGQAHQTKWRAWAGGLGDALVTPAIPLNTPKVVSANGVSNGARPDRLTGYSIVEADSLDRAVEMVTGNPHLEHGTIEVAEVMIMPS